MLRETEIDADTDEIIKVVEYTLGHDQISQTTIPYSSGTPGTPETVFFASDGHGSVRMLLDMAGAIATIAGMRQLFHYDAYGNAVGFNMAAAATTFLYSGEQFDPRIGQQYLRARYYDPATGRFNRLDPFFGNSQDPQSFHKYLYTHADPINGFDPTGESVIINFTMQALIRGGLSALVFGAISGIWAYKRGATAWQAVWAGFKTAALTGFAFVSPLFAWTMLVVSPVLIGLEIYSGDLTMDDAPEIMTYIGAALLMHILFRNPQYNAWEVKTVLKAKLPRAINNLNSGNTIDPAQAGKWRQAVQRGDRSAQGSLIHKELSDIMRREGMSNLNVEVSYDANGNIVRYGARGSVRLDYEVTVRGKTVKVYDIKPSDMLDGTWVNKVASRLKVDPSEVQAISYEQYVPPVQ